MQAYSNPKRESDTHSLPDIEVWEDYVTTVHCRCGDYDVPFSHFAALGPNEEFRCPSCEKAIESHTHSHKLAWWYWFCFPGCLPDSDVHGPFDSEEGALEDARDGMEDYEDEEDEEDEEDNA